MDFTVTSIVVVVNVPVAAVPVAAVPTEVLLLSPPRTRHGHILRLERLAV